MKTLSFLFLMVITSCAVFAQSRDMQEAALKTIKFFPNPAVSKITFSFEKSYEKNSTFQIFNFIGKKVLDLRSVTPTTVIDLTEFYRGVYIFQLRDKSGKIIEAGKFQVAK